MSLLAQPVPNYEEAATVAADFISSLDNLPQEVQHLLEEIKLKDSRCQEIQQDIAKDQMRYIKSALKQSALPPTTILGQGNSRTASPVATPTPTSVHSKAHLPARIANAYAELETLSNEKTEIAQNILNLLTRTRSRLDSDLARVRTLQGEPAEDVRNAYIPNIPSVAQLRSASPYGLKRGESLLSGTNPVIQIGESLRNAAQGDNIISISAAPGPSYTKKRKINSNTSIKLPSPAPVSIPQHSSSHSRSRLSRQTAARIQQQQEEEDLDADAEGEEDIDEDAEEDLTLYCFCRKQSYGDMIGCDNPDCPYQWFHISCVGVKTPLPDKWYCPDCIKAKQEKRKGRKKQ